jgi:hypothetical protein
MKFGHRLRKVEEMLLAQQDDERSATGEKTQAQYTADLAAWERYYDTGERPPGISDEDWPQHEAGVQHLGDLYDQFVAEKDRAEAMDNYQESGDSAKPEEGDIREDL